MTTSSRPIPKKGTNRLSLGMRQLAETALTRKMSRAANRRTHTGAAWTSAGRYFIDQRLQVRKLNSSILKHLRQSFPQIVRRHRNEVSDGVHDAVQGICI